MELLSTRRTAATNTPIPTLALCLALAGCPTDDPDPPLLTDLPNLPGGNPLVPDVAMYPFPSDLYLEDDPSKVTGRRLRLPEEAMPEGLPPSTFDGIDGFSRAPAILSFFEGGIAPDSLPPLADPSASLEDDSSVWLLHATSGTRVPLLAEVDLHAEDLDEQALILRPQVALEPDADYVVVLRDGLRSADGGGPPPVTDAFRALRDGIATDCPEVEAQREGFALVNEAVAAQGLDASSVILAWRFHTRSAEQLHDPLLAMHDTAASWPLEGWTIASDAWDEGHQNRLIRGTFPAPDFLGPEDWVALDDDGEVVVHGGRTAPFLLTVPATSEGDTRPVLVFGHGFFNDLDEPAEDSLDDGLQHWRMAAASTSFIGFCEEDQVETLSIILGETERLWSVTSQQMQSQANFTLLARLVAEELAPEVTWDDGTPVFDAQAVHYLGISNGGTQGVPILAASPVFTRGALVVPGGAWMHMLERADDWTDMGPIIALRFPDARDLQLVLSLLQMTFDPIDSVSWAEHLIDDRLEGRPPLEVVLHEAIGDGQVSNMVTEWMARTAGFPLVEPSAKDIWGLPTVSAAPPDGAPGEAAMIVYDLGLELPPEGNLPPDQGSGAHGAVRRLEVYREHLGAFFEDGSIVQLCDGACDPE